MRHLFLKTSQELMDTMFDQTFSVDSEDLPVSLPYENVIFVMEDVDAASPIVKSRDRAAERRRSKRKRAAAASAAAAAASAAAASRQARMCSIFFQVFPVLDKARHLEYLCT